MQAQALATRYFPKPGKGNTTPTIQAAIERARDLGIRHIVVASTTGDTALRVARAAVGRKVSVVCVTYHAGFSGKGDEMTIAPDRRAELEKAGVAVLACSHALSGVGRSVTNKFGGVTPTELIAHTLRLFGSEGLKVAVEVAVMAADAGLAPTDREIIALGGSGRGCDTALVLRAAHMNTFFDLEVREIIAKPRQRSA